MSPITMILTVVLLVCSAVLIAIILSQSERSANMSSALTGSSGNAFGKNKGATRDLFLKRTTVILAIIFIVIVLIVNIFEIV